MIDVHPPTTDGREIILSRYPEPEPELRLLIDRMKLDLPAQPPPKIAAAASQRYPSCGEDLFVQGIDFLDDLLTDCQVTVIRAGKATLHYITVFRSILGYPSPKG
jgi:hypothetical protein